MFHPQTKCKTSKQTLEIFCTFLHIETQVRRQLKRNCECKMVKPSSVQIISKYIFCMKLTIIEYKRTKLTNPCSGDNSSLHEVTHKHRDRLELLLESNANFHEKTVTVVTFCKLTFGFFSQIHINFEYKEELLPKKVKIHYYEETITES